MHCLACGTDGRPIVRFTPNGVVEACGKCTAPIGIERPVSNDSFLVNTEPVHEPEEVTRPLVPVTKPVASKQKRQPEDFLSQARRRLVEIRRELKNHDKLRKEEAAICMMLQSFKAMQKDSVKH